MKREYQTPLPQPAEQTRRSSVSPCALPANALLAAYARDNIYTDCFGASIDGEVPLARLIGAFYTTPLFRLERLVLDWAFGRPSSDADVDRLAAGVADDFAAWRVEASAADQILLTDIRGRTRSWLMAAPDADQGGVTRLYFGSAVIPGSDGRGGGLTLLLRLHRLYSVLLLGSARARLRRRGAHGGVSRQPRRGDRGGAG